MTRLLAFVELDITVGVRVDRLRSARGLVTEMSIELCIAHGAQTDLEASLHIGDTAVIGDGHGGRLLVDGQKRARVVVIATAGNQPEGTDNRQTQPESSCTHLTRHGVVLP